MRVCTGRILIIVGAVLTSWFWALNSGFATSISLSGNDWFIHEDPSSIGATQKFYEADVKGGGWVPAQVPGNIQADLENAHLLNPFCYGAGDARVAAVAKQDWWYRKDFVIPED